MQDSRGRLYKLHLRICQPSLHTFLARQEQYLGSGVLGMRFVSELELCCCTLLFGARTYYMGPKIAQPIFQRINFQYWGCILFLMQPLSVEVGVS